MEVQKIGEGNTAEVFTWGENDILKLFRKEFPIREIEQEYRISKVVEGLEVPIPRVRDMLEYEGRTGIVYEKIMGISLLKLLIDKPWIASGLAKTIARMHYDMHQQSVQGIPDCVETLRWRINHADNLPSPQKEEVLKTLDSLPRGSSLCHCDYHPGNIIKGDDRYVILDWMTATSGCASYDVARTIYLIRDAALPDYIPRVAKLAMNWMRRRLTNRYISCYKRLSGMQQKEIAAWRLPLIAARLTEWVPKIEEEAILAEIKEKTGVK